MYLGYVAFVLVGSVMRRKCRKASAMVSDRMTMIESKVAFNAFDEG